MHLSKLVLIITLAMSVNMSISQTLQTVPFVDIEKYAGTWYEIASFPQRFQKNCTNTTAEYSLTDKDYLIVVNKCNKDSIDGKLVMVKGKAFIEKNSGNAKLKIQFFWPFKGKYWIIDLADDYSYAVVGHPNRKYLWILSRTKTLDINIYDKILKDCSSKGFDVSKIKITQQN
jgi:apolipoprotein D and lipocalin family protein